MYLWYLHDASTSRCKEHMLWTLIDVALHLLVVSKMGMLIHVRTHTQDSSHITKCSGTTISNDVCELEINHSFYIYNDVYALLSLKSPSLSSFAALSRPIFFLSDWFKWTPSYQLQASPNDSNG